MFGRPSLARALAAVAAASLVAAAAPAQANELDAAKKPTFARVEAKDGTTLANAVVAFAGCVPHIGVDAGPRDVQLVQTDARGRAQCKLQPGLCYVAWAVGPAAADGSCVTSDVFGWFGAGTLFTLRCGEPRQPRTLRIKGADAWAAHGPLRYVLHAWSPGPDAALEPDAQGGIVVPPGPARTIEVQTSDGVPLLHVSVEAQQIAIPPPHRLRVRACDENGGPLAGAPVRLRVGRIEGWRVDNFPVAAADRWRALGVTGADGTCTVEVPYPADPLRDQGHGDLMLFVGAPGRPPVVGGVFSRDLFVDGAKVAKAERDELAFTCRRAEPLAGSVGRAPAGTVVQLAATCKLMLERNGFRTDVRLFQAKVAADGAFAFDDVPADLQSCRFMVVAPSGLATAWPAFAPLRARELPAEVQAPETSLVGGEGLAAFEVQVREPGGDPARGLVVLLTPSNTNGISARDSTVRVPLDSRGTASLRLAPGRWVITAWTEAGWVGRLFELKAGSVRESLSMQPPEVMRLELRGADGRPIAGASVRTRGLSVRGSGDPLQSVLQSMRSQWTPRWNSLRTDDEGRVSVPFVPVDGITQKIGLHWDGGQTDDLQLEATAQWTAVSPK